MPTPDWYLESKPRRLLGKKKNLVPAKRKRSKLSYLNGRRVSLDDSGRLPVAKLVAVKKEARPEERIAAIERIKKLASGLSLGGLKVKDLISEGRR